MTTIAATYYAGTVRMVADTRVTGGECIMRAVSLPKIYAIGRWRVGLAGPVSAVQLMVQGLYAATDKYNPWDMLRQAHGYAKAHGLRPDHTAGAVEEIHVQMLMAHPEQGLMLVTEDGAILPIREGHFWAIGSGASYALGAMTARHAEDTEAAKDAVFAASLFDPNTGRGQTSATVTVKVPGASAL